MTDCPTEEALIAALDGEATVNADARTRAHLAECGRCRNAWKELEEILAGIRAPYPTVDVDRAVAGVLRRISAPVIEPAPPRRRWRGAALVAGSILAAAGVALVAGRGVPLARVGKLAPSADEQEFAARGGGALTLAQAVRVTFEREGTALVALAGGETVAKDAKLTVVYRNAREREPAYLLAFAVDARKQVHWLFPAYEQAGENPASVRLASAVGEAPLGTSVILDDPSSGPIHLLSIVSAVPRHVADVESLSPTALSLDALRARFHDDVVDETTISFP